MARPSREGEIRDAALACFARGGYDGTSVRSIAERAGVSDAAIYSHWAGKRELAADLYAEVLRVYAGRLAEIAGSEGDSVGERLRAVALGSLELYRERPDAWAFAVQNQGRLLDALPHDFPYPLRVLEALIAEGQADGSVRVGPVRTLASVALGCFTYPVIVAIYGARGAPDPLDAAGCTAIAEATWDAVAARRRAPAGRSARPRAAERQ